jgi:predicted deacylase
VSYANDSKIEVSQKSRKLALAFGYPCVKSGQVITRFPGPASANGYAAGVLGIPAINADIGGSGFGRALEERWIEMNIRGIRNVMVYSGMLKGELDLPDRYLTWEKRWRVNPSVGGYLFTKVGYDGLMMEVRKGQVLGEVVSPHTFKVLEVLEAPCDGVLAYAARDYPVRPGDWAFGVVDLSDQETEWISNPLS